MAKIANGLLSGTYSKPVTVGEDVSVSQVGISPSMFKAVISKGHPDFSSMRQQDAQEFLQHLVKVIEQKERANGSDPTNILKFTTEQRIECEECHHVRYIEEKDSILLNLPVPAKLDESQDTEAYLPVTFDECLASYFGKEKRTFSCSVCKKTTNLARYVVHIPIDALLDDNVLFVVLQS
jgi:ubiquitin carboxyl-terminal hydrolase 5/13